MPTPRFAMHGPRAALIALLVGMACGPASSDDWTIFAANSFENAANVIPPGSNPSCPLGAIVLSTGQAGNDATTKQLATRPLYESDLTTIDRTSTTTSVSFPVNANETPNTDSQIVRMHDGSIVAMTISRTWAPLPAGVTPPAWMSTGAQIQFGRILNSAPPSPQANARNELLFVRSTDCGATWSRYGTLDSAVLDSGKFSWPQNASPPPYIGGWDRPELYADAFSQTLYVSTDGDSATYQFKGPDGTPLTGGAAGTVIVHSTDAQTWDVMAELPDGRAPMVMTTTPNERFYAFTCSTGTPTLYYTKTPGDWTTLTTTGFDLSKNAGFTLPACGVDTTIDSPLPAKPRNSGSSISRVSTDATSSVVRIAYPALDSSGRQIYQVITATIDDANPANPPNVGTGGLKIAADDPTTRSVAYATFVEPDYVDMPAGTTSSKAMLYWIETSTGNSGSSRLCARYSVFETPILGDAQQYLSQTGNQARCWTDPTEIGDYMAGGFYWYGKQLNYFGQWNEGSGVHGNVVSIAP